MMGETAEAQTATLRDSFARLERERLSSVNDALVAHEERLNATASAGGGGLATVADGIAWAGERIVRAFSHSFRIHETRPCPATSSA